MKSDYSWITKGQSKETKCIKFSGTLSVIMAI